MPKSLTRPVPGQWIWYYANNPPVGLPSPALVCQVVSEASEGQFGPAPTYNLYVIAPDGTVTGAVTGVPYYYGSRPVGAIAWCTMMRVRVPASGAYPSGG